MNAIQLLGALELGLIYSIVALGVYLSFRILQFPDLTVDGSFPLGSGVSAALIVAGYDPLVAIGVATLSGFIAGLITAFMATRLKMLNLIAGILTMTALYSINLRIMGGPNISLLEQASIFSKYFAGISPVLVCAGIATIVFSLTYLLLSTELGLSIRATGSNERMSKAQGINDQNMILIGISFANSLVALGGALFAQSVYVADINSGTGTIVIGLAAVVIGEALLPTRKILLGLLGCIVGCIVYHLVIAMALNLGDFGMKSSDRNLFSAILVGVALVSSVLKKK